MAVPKIKIENARGEVLDFSTDPRYLPILTGTGPVAATINRSKASTADGSQYNSATVEDRPLLLTVYFRRDVARARLNLYRYVATKQYIKVYYQNDGLDVYVEGYVETAEVNPWEENQNIQVSIICPMPYWRDVAETYTDASNVIALFELPFFTDEAGVELSQVDKTASTVIENKGTVEAGVTFVITASVQSQNPRIYNLSTGEYIGFYVDMLQGDQLEVCTTTGSKRVTHIRDGVRSNYINTVMEGSKWLQMAVGANEYSYTVEDGECTLGIYHTNMYTGV